MLLCIGTTGKIQIITGTAVSTIEAHASYITLDEAATPNTIACGTTNADITTATTTDIVGVAGSNKSRNVKTLNIKNSHASSSCVITVQHTDGTTIIELYKITLLAGEVLAFIDGGGWQHFDASGILKVTMIAAGQFLGRSVLVSGTTFTTTSLTTKILAWLIGGGGGGGGCTSVASAACGAGGGGAGGYAEKLFVVTQSTGYTYAIGGAGTGVSGAAGNNGGNTTFAVGATTVTAFGGTGAPIGTAATTLVARAGGAGGVVSTNGDLNAAGAPGEYGVVLIVATPIIASGNGGSSEYGSGGLGLIAVGNGNAGIGYGAGGGGSATGASTVRTGGNGTAGAIIVEEYA